MSCLFGFGVAKKSRLLSYVGMPYKDKDKQREAQKKHYIENSDTYKFNRRKNRDKKDVWILAYKSDKKCHCGESDHRCLDFHHKNPSKKSFSISYAVKNGYSKERILAEIKKCKIICANCHRKEHCKFAKQHRIPASRVRTVLWVWEYKKTKLANVVNLALKF